MKAYKGFNKDMTCHGFQYKEGEIYHEDEAKCSERGFHACEYPLDCLSYYSPENSEYHEVDVSGKIRKIAEDNDSKFCGTDIKVGAKLSIAGLVKAAIDFTFLKAKNEEHATGNRGASSATGSCGASSATGSCGASSATGYRGASSATGDCGASSATGYRGASLSASATGVAVAWGPESLAAGCAGTTLVFADWVHSENDVDIKNIRGWRFKGSHTFIVDGKTIKEFTYYSYRNGMLTEISDKELSYCQKELIERLKRREGDES